jgi:hypothetical protein
MNSGEQHVYPREFGSAQTGTLVSRQALHANTANLAISTPPFNRSCNAYAKRATAHAGNSSPSDCNSAPATLPEEPNLTNGECWRVMATVNKMVEQRDKSAIRERSKSKHDGKNAHDHRGRAIGVDPPPG